ncbi:MAG: SbcC/MukB-like Walker B domain-containing protein [Pirellulaceae bacterium]
MGPFCGLHRATFDPNGTAIIGPTGSGKTTLVDALMTLLIPAPKYNLASTGGHESDRTLIEYVRGVLGGDGADGRQEVARPGKTISGICATYVGGNQTLKLAALFWTEGTGNSADDLKRRWVFSLADDQSLEHWLRMLHDDGVRELLKMGRETADLRFFDSKKAYLERVRKFFDVGENAFTLLNRAAGLKQLNSIDEIFRELVLDDRSAFDRAIEVAAEFDKLNKYAERQKEIEKQLVRRMGIAKNVDTGALTDVGTEIEDVPYFLERLKVLTDEALPEKRARFLEYLNRSSDQGVTQLLANIDEEVDAIENRIAELNQTLLRVDFRSGRYLQLQPQRMKDERLRTLNVAMQKVRSAALKDDGGESHFVALQSMVIILREAGENRRLQGSKALLDPRFRLEFFVVEVDRETGVRSPPRTGSQSGSGGGEKELMASHILTASLSYALCPAASTRPLYGTVILDEAFSKSSPSAATRIIEALRIFKLHPVFVTPNKEIGLLKQHTRKVICVQRPGKAASLASISWEKLEQLARSQ